MYSVSRHVKRAGVWFYRGDNGGKSDDHSGIQQQDQAAHTVESKGEGAPEEDVFVVEGTKMFLEAPAEKLRDVYVSESFLENAAAGSGWNRRAMRWFPIRFAKISDTCTPQGILCVVEQFHYNMESLLQKENPVFLLLENIQDPGNLGTMLRTGEGAGISGVIMSRDTVDLYNPKVIRSTMGSIYRMPFLYAEDFAGAIGSVRQAGVSVYAAHLKGKTSYIKQDYRRARRF